MAVQKRTILDWDDVRVFLAVAEAQSFSGAARTLGVNHVTIARRLSRLEAGLGVTLFDRRRGGYVLAAGGRSLLDEARAMEAAAAGLALRAREGDGLAGVVRVSTIATFAERLLAEPLARLCAAHVGLEIELSGEDRNVSLSRGDADVTLRFGRPSATEAVARRIGEAGHRLYAAPAYLAATPAEHWRFIGFTEDLEQVAPGARRLVELAAGRPFAMRASTLTAQLRAAAAGAGVALLPCLIAEPEPGLARATPEAGSAWSQPLWLMLRSDARRVPRVRLVADAIADAARVQAAALRGD